MQFLELKFVDRPYDHPDILAYTREKLLRRGHHEYEITNDPPVRVIVRYKTLKSVALLSPTLRLEASDNFR